MTGLTRTTALAGFLAFVNVTNGLAQAPTPPMLTPGRALNAPVTAEPLAQTAPLPAPAAPETQTLAPVSNAPQPTGPRRLFMPKTPTQPVETPRVEETIPQPETPQIVTGDDVGSVSLGFADRDSFGILNEEQGGFGVNMWQGSPRHLVQHLLPLLPEASRSRVMRDLARRLLLSSATAPEGPAPTGDSLLAARIETLARLGELDAVAELSGLSPLRRESNLVARAETDSLLLAGKTDQACEGAKNYLPLHEDVYWQKLSAFCQALNGETGKAAFGLNLVRELETDPDRTYGALMDRLLGATTIEIPAPSAPTAIQLALYRAAKVALPPVFFDRNRIDLAIGAVSNEANKAESRLDAAERAARIGALPMETLRQIYADLTLPAAALHDPLELGLDPLEPKTRAVFHRAAAATTTPEIRAEILAQMLNSAQQTGLFPLTARILADLVAELPITQEMAWFAPVATRVFLVDGDLIRADEWLTLWRDEARVVPELQAALVNALPILILGDLVPPGSASAEAIASWLRAYLDRAHAAYEADPTIATRTPQDVAALIYAGLTAIGTPMDEEIWPLLLQPPFQSPGIAPNGALMARLADAALKQRVGETVLLCLLALGNNGVTEVRADTLAAVMQSLSMVGLADDARKMALEAALAAAL